MEVEKFLLMLDSIRADIAAGKPCSFTFIWQQTLVRPLEGEFHAPAPGQVMHLLLSVGEDPQAVESEHRPAAAVTSEFLSRDPT